MSQTIVVDPRKVEQLILPQGMFCSKVAFIAGIYNLTGRKLTYDTILANGHRETQDMIFDKGFWGPVQSTGEFHTLVGNDGNNSFPNVYDMSDPRPRSGWEEEAERFSSPLTPHAYVTKAVTMLLQKNPGVKRNQLPYAYFMSSNRIQCWRLPEDVGTVLIPKESWNEVQDVPGDGVLSFSINNQDGYMIGKHEYLPNWCETNGDRVREELYQAIPQLTWEELKLVLVDSQAGLEGQELANQVLQERSQS